MRLFFALDPEAELKRHIDDWRFSNFRELTISGRARLVPADNFHVTLAFIGDVEQRDVDSLCSGVDDLADEGGLETGQLLLSELGYWQRPGILWLGPRECPASLHHLVRKLKSVGARFGGRRGVKPFMPHLTLFRGCDVPPPQSIERPGFYLKYGQFLLMQSTRSGSGVRYQPLALWKLG